MSFITNPSIFSGLKLSNAQRKVKSDLECIRKSKLFQRKRIVPERRRLGLVACGTEEDRTHQRSQWGGEDSDYFGRDPRKETEFWMEHAKEVLESKEVADAVEAHKKSGSSNLTEEQKAWLEFARSITPKPEDEE
ncbi:uncharacterized protein Gasu_19280 [Galdieria sulphuraria]|uniref:Uncharacterized protein n=1 Tax=Galdieria sulphuraria TaxID=130081 RepID=M2W4K7_GALSU|nr:uncharacterized protein Gasu_19280 [Galdieria sulphuraria]EME30681.1 hypothetical protein Gasu_19280 [Galdieria sulphuraria]|eukprot:XP_005707201.1 hypothetical protein Gasu_19280 [Galdieria sulphuraria]